VIRPTLNVNIERGELKVEHWTLNVFFFLLTGERIERDLAP